MTGLRMTGRSNFGRRGRKSRGFTLVELIVVLTIIALLAAVGVATALGFINRSKFDQNSQNAITIYQTAQSVLSEKSMNGTMDEWVTGLSAFKGQLFDPALEAKLLDDKEANRSINKTIALTYNPKSANNSEDKYLFELLRGSFYDMTVFTGTMAVELDISATYGNGKINYSARVLSAFYSRENDIASGWDDIRKGNGYVQDDPELKDLPRAKGSEGYAYRRRTSFVGWFNGTSESITAPSGVLPVFLPQSKVQPLEGHIVAGEQNGYLFNLRNGETLDVSWAIFDYDGTARKNHNEDIVITLNSAENGHDTTVIRGNDTSDANFYDGVQICISHEALSAFLSSVESKPSTTLKENVNGIYDITRTSQDGFIKATVVRTENGTSKTYANIDFPITVTLVSGDGRKGTARDAVGNLADYYEFRLSLDAMMVRADESSADPKWNHYGIDRMLGYKREENINRLNPRNIYATLHGTWNSTKANGSSDYVTVDQFEPTEAARAIDDPVYLTNVRQTNGEMTYIYFVEFNSGLGRYDEQDSTNSENGNIITGRCVVNSLFGDLNYSNSYDPADADAVSGTFWSSTGGNAVITSYRHLYNIRKVFADKTATFRIVKNLDWYVHDTVMINGTITELYSSEVKVFKTGTTGYNSPVMGNQLKVVSFPAFKELKAKHTLTSMSKADGKIYSINNVQLRSVSFQTSDPAYGLICKNSGTIFNIYTNNLNLVLTNKDDGDPNDYKNICPDSSVNFSYGAANPVSSGKGYPVGGLIGTNSSVVGRSDIDENLNTIRMSNSIVMVGSYWNANKECNEVGGVIGLANPGSSTNGVIELKGSFAVVSGGKNTGGIIGDAKMNIGARLVVDGNADAVKSEFDLPVCSVTNQKMSCVISGRGNIAGAVAYIDGQSFTYTTGKQVSPNDISINADTGKLTFPETDDNDYQIDVSVPENGLIIKNGYYDNSVRPIGGAIGNWLNGTGDYTSIRVRNDGYIIATDITKNVHCGGAVGRETASAVSQVYINVNNGEHSRVGSTLNTNGPVAVGGAYGRLDGSRAGTIMINAVNNGTIISRGNDNGLGSGGAIGGVADNVKTRFLINVVNQSNSKIIGVGSTAAKNYGTGGAIGGMNSTNVILSDSVINAENYGLISGVYYVGGTIGRSATNEGEIYSSVYGRITGSKEGVGGTIGYISEPQRGRVQAILDHANIDGVNFVGGAAGRVQNFRNDTGTDLFVRTVVQGDSTVKTTSDGSLVGGVVGDVYIQGNGSNGYFELYGHASSPVLTVEGTDGVGGVAGLMRANSANYTSVVTPDQGAANKLIVSVTGRNYIGGTIGKLRSASINDNNINNLLNSSQSTNDSFVKIVSVLNPQSSIIGSGDNVGGVVGCIDSNSGAFKGYISLSSAVGSSNGGSVIQGNLNVGGAVGQFYKTNPSDSSSTETSAGISVDFSNSPWTVKSNNGEGTDANLGGAVGYFNSGSNDVGTNTSYSSFGIEGTLFPITVNLGSSTVESDGNNVGGAIGKNLIRNGIVDVTLNGTVSGGANVGGAIGVNRARINTINVYILGNGEVHGKSEKSIDFTVVADCTGGNVNTGSNTGGAIGYNNSPVTVGVNVVINGSVIGDGGNVGGAIGYCYATHNQKENGNLLWIKSILVTLQGNSRVESAATCVGGALGYTLGNIETVQTTITGNSKIKGDTQVGGAIGFATAYKNIAGATVATLGPGIIKRAEAIITADEALVGGSKIGGVVGEAGYKKYIGTQDNWGAPRFETIRAEVNAAKLFDTDETGVDRDEEAMIGGVVGHYCDGTCGEIILGGTGGVVELNDDNMNYPKRTYDHSILIQAKGSSIGGIVGLIGTDMYHQNVYLSNITVEENGPNICVVSVNGADRIGGWIGSGNGDGGGLGYRYEADWKLKHATYEVNTVKVVYSEGSYVGGFIGYMEAYGRVNTDNASSLNKYTDNHTWADVTVNLDGATIMGKSCVGGAIGGQGYCRWVYGKLDVNYSNYTNVGDIGNPVPGDENEYTRICYESGGAIGYSYGKVNRENLINIPINVVIDSTSQVCALADQESDGFEFEDFGVGGVFGSIDNTIVNLNNVVASVTTDPSVVSVYSANTNVGGFIGVMESGSITLSGGKRTVNFYRTDANVRTNGSNACAGGFVGRVDGGTINYSLATGNVVSYGNESRSGGFVGSLHGVAATTVENCFTTSVVESKGSYSGGFVGVVDGEKSVTIKSSYVGGHTYDGQYVANEGNISGVNNVGGFIGANTGAGSVSITDSYSTASVVGAGDSIGGFIGSMNNTCKLDNCYSVGRVIGPNADTVGAFAGSLTEINNNRFSTTNKCKSLSGINGGELRLVGSVGGEILGDTDVKTWIVFDTERGIRGQDGLCDGYPYDNSLITDSASGKGQFPLKPFINNAHYGDWPVQTGDRISIANAEIIWNQDKVQFVDGVPTFVYTSDVSAEAIKSLLTINVEGTSLEWDSDCTLTIENNVNVGQALVYISGQGDYAGIVKTSFNIVPLDIKDVEGVHTTIVELVQEHYDYTGAPVTPILSVSINILGEDGQVKNIPLTVSTDYYLTYEHLDLGNTNNIRPGRVQITVHGTGNYTGIAEAENQKRVYIIDGLNLRDAEVELINSDELIYTGSELEPEVLVRLNNRYLVKDQDYTVAYNNNIDAGDNTAKVIIEHVEGSNYVGQIEKDFTIKPATNKWIEEPDIEDWIYGNPSVPHGKHSDGTDLEVEYYLDSACTIKTTEANSGTTDGDGGRPVNVGTYYMKAKALLTPNTNSNVDEGTYFYNHTND